MAVIAGEAVADAIGRAGDREGMVVHNARLERTSEHITFFQIIHRTISIAIHTIFKNACECARTILPEQIRPAVDIAIACPILRAVTRLFVGRYIIAKRSCTRTGEARLEAYVEIIIEVKRIAFLGVLSGNQDHTPCSTRAIDCGRSGILEHADALYIFGVERIDISFGVVNEDQG